MALPVELLSPRAVVDPRPRVVIVGGGFAGLYAAKGLKRAPVHVTVVDRRNHHLFQPMLYQVATAALNPSDIANPIRSILRRQKNTDVLLGEVGVGRCGRAREVLARRRREPPYDYLVVATGARHSYFGHDEWERLAPGLKSLEDAVEIRNRVLLAFEEAEREIRPELRQALLTFVVVGGGPTGVELAGALAEIRNFALKRDFRQINPRDATVMLIEAGPRILASYPPELSERAVTELRRLGVEVRTDHDGDGHRASGRCRRANSPSRRAPYCGRQGTSRARCSSRSARRWTGRAAPSLSRTARSPGIPRSSCWATRRISRFGEDTLPGICPAAIQMGQYAARVIRDEVAGRRPARRVSPEGQRESSRLERPPFSYWDKGQLAVIGRGHAVADIGRLHFGGFIAWLAWIFVHIFFLIGFRNRVLVLIQWAYSYFTYRRGARIITGEVGTAAPRRARSVSSLRARPTRFVPAPTSVRPAGRPMTTTASSV